MFNGWSCRGKMSYFSVNNGQKMTLIAAKKATTEPLSVGKTGSRRQSVMMQQQITHCPASFLHFTTFPPFFLPDTVPPHPKSPAGGLDTKQTQHIPNTQQPNLEDTKKDANTRRLDGSACVHQRTGLD